METSENIARAASDEREKSRIKSSEHTSSVRQISSDTAVDGDEAVSVASVKKVTPIAISKARQATTKVKVSPRAKIDVNLRTLLEAGVHFGHQTSRWDPSMASNIHSIRNGIHIINLPKTIQAWLRSKKAIHDVVANGGSVLFVGTKKQAQEALVEEALRSNAFYVSRRWLGGMITNFQTIRRSIDRMKKVEAILQEEEQLQAAGQPQKFTKKERLMMTRELDKLEFSLGGIKEMHAPPQILFVIDIKREEIAVREAKRAGIPVVALVDTNCNPAAVLYPIPSNDDGTRAIRLFCGAVADVILEAKGVYAEKARAAKEESRRKSDSARAKKSSAAAAESGEEKPDSGAEQVTVGEGEEAGVKTGSLDA